jgi:hypothetical protein
VRVSGLLMGRTWCEAATIRQRGLPNGSEKLFFRPPDCITGFDLFHPSDFFDTLPRQGDHLKSWDTRCPAMSDQGLRPVGGAMGLTKEHFGNPIAGGKAKGDFIELLFQFGVHIWKTNQYGLAKRTLRRLLNDAVYSLRRRPEGHYVAIVMATRNHTGTRDARVKWQSNMIELTGGTAKLPAPI